MEKLEGMHRAALDSYDQVLRAVAEYPVEIDPSEVQLYQRHMEALRRNLADASGGDDYQVIHTSFRGEVRLYRDKVNEWLTSMRGELKAAAEAMQTLSIRVAENGNGHEQRLRTDLEQLTSVVQCDDLGRIRTTVQQVAAAIAKSYEQLRDANSLLIAQLRDEIQSLHREMANARRSLFQDRSSGVWNRQKIEARLEELLEHERRFCRGYHLDQQLQAARGELIRRYDQWGPEGHGSEGNRRGGSRRDDGPVGRRPIHDATGRRYGRGRRDLQRACPKALLPIRCTVRRNRPSAHPSRCDGPG